MLHGDPDSKEWDPTYLRFPSNRKRRITDLMRKLNPGPIPRSRTDFRAFFPGPASARNLIYLSLAGKT